MTMTVFHVTNSMWVAALLFCCIATSVNGFLTDNPDEVTSLPGLPRPPSFKHYSGYLNATNGRFLHYWFVESQGNPAKDPLLVWMNGGPGCSSLDGLLSEHGPFLVESNGKVLNYNPTSWNKVGSVLYLEAPAGVGFSYSLDKNYTFTDDDVSLDNYVALQHFFKKFPQFTANDLYITGESYGGIYVPTLAARLLTGTFPNNLKGFAVGNGITTYELNDISAVFFSFYHGLIGVDLWENLVKYCCNGSASKSTCEFHDPKAPDCLKYVTEAASIITSIGLNMYNIYEKCKPSKSWYRMLGADYGSMFRPLDINRDASMLENHISQGGYNEEPPCINSENVESWINRPEVRQAIHVPTFVQNWTVCSGEVGALYQRTYESMEKHYKLLLPKVRGLIYNGDVDMACNFLGCQWFAESLKREVLSTYKPWDHKGQVAGFYKEWENLMFVTIKGAGHMSPRDKPGQALEVIARFINNQPMS